MKSQFLKTSTLRNHQLEVFKSNPVWFLIQWYNYGKKLPSKMIIR